MYRPDYGPCPKCGEEELYMDEDLEAFTWTRLFCIKCTNCAFEAANGLNEEQAEESFYSGEYKGE